MRQRARVWSAAAWYLIAALSFGGLSLPSGAEALTLTVKGTDAIAITSYRWAVELDNTQDVKLGAPTCTGPSPCGVSDPFSASLSIQKSHAYIIASGHSSDLSDVEDLDSTKRYAISILMDAPRTHTIGSVLVPKGATAAEVLVNPYPILAAQMRVAVFEDIRALSGAFEIPAEHGLEGFHIKVEEMAGHQAFDVFGNTLGTTYTKVCSIAATACTSRIQPYSVKGATGFGVRLLLELLRDWR